MRPTSKDLKDCLDFGDMLQIPAEEISDGELIVSSPKLSVILMTRNHEAFVAQSINSILKQQCAFAFEVLIGEDFSTDNTRSVCEDLQKKYPNKIRLIVADRNVGITPNFLRLVARARGEYIALLEGDDYWTDLNKLSIQVKLMEENPEFAWCGARTINRTLCMPPVEFYTLEETLRRYIVHTSTIVFRREYLSSYPRFPDVVGWISMVYAYLATKGLCGFINKELSYYRHHQGGVWTGATISERVRLTRIFTDTMNDYFSGNYQLELADRELWIHGLHLEALLSDWGFTHWKDLLRTLPVLVHRCGRLQPWITFRTVWLIIVASITFTIRWGRRKLAIRTRVKALFGHS